MAVSDTTEKMKQLLIWEQGRMYDSLKYSAQWKNRWIKNCKALNICSTTVDRFIDYFHIVNYLPRLLITGIGYSVIVSNFDKLMKYLDLHPNLKGQLKSPLRNIKLTVVDQELAQCLPRGDAEVPTITTQAAYWGFGFEVLDQSKATTSSSDDT